jgi:hypothetical protein
MKERIIKNEGRTFQIQTAKRRRIWNFWGICSEAINFSLKKVFLLNALIKTKPKIQSRFVFYRLQRVFGRAFKTEILLFYARKIHDFVSLGNHEFGKYYSDSRRPKFFF